MTKPNDPAFPSLERFEKYNDEMGRYEEHTLPCGGLTRREYFAGLAMQGICASTAAWHEDWQPEKFAEAAITLSDALINKLEMNP